MDYKKVLKKVYDEQRDFNIKKNEEYGNFYFEPIAVFSSLPAKTRIESRLDEKLGRVKYKGLDKELAADLVGCLMCWLALDSLEKS